jgi:hypothetical protein
MLAYVPVFTGPLIVMAVCFTGALFQALNDHHRAAH